MSERLVFSETQRFTQPWLWLIIGGVGAGTWYGAWQQLVQGRPFGSNPAPDTALVLIFLLSGIMLPALFLALRLQTEVDADGIRVRFFPFHLRAREWRWEDIESIEVRQYSPLREYGGWGIRYGVRGIAYNVRGDQGVDLLLRSGLRVLIGTQNAEGFSAAIEAAQSRPRR